MQMILSAGCTTTLTTDADTPAVILLCPQTGDGQTVMQSELRIMPEGSHNDFTDAFGNICRRVMFSRGESVVHCTCTVEVPTQIAVDARAEFTLVQDVPDDILQYLVPSRYCQSDMLLKEASRITKKARPGYEQVESIRRWIQRRIRYKYGVSNESTSALDTLRKGAGVCRDFSHIGIAMCRALRIPARMVFGFLHKLDPMDLHAWFEAFVGGRWYTFDATQKEPRGNRIIVAYGRDAADIAQITNYGPLEVKQQTVWVRPG